MTGFGAEALTKETIAEAADYMRDKMIENSKVFPGVTDGTTTISNISGSSVGVDGDNYKIGGTRLDLDKLCGPNNERCKTNPDGSLDLNQTGKVQFIGNLEDYLKSQDGKSLAGLTGGIQGWTGTLHGVDYDPASLKDKWIEYYAGPHDYVGGYMPGLYDNQGNARRGQSAFASNFYDAWTAAAIPVATPFAMAKGLPPGIWEAIQKLVYSR